jgi:hypothetical protein
MKLKIFFIIFLAGLCVISCKKDDDNGQQPSGNLVFIEDDIDIPTTWYADSIYIIEDWDFWVSDALTIEPGTIIKFTSNTHMTIDSYGTIIAQGSAEKTIIFTSYKDDAHGGDNNGDGDATSPSRGDWFNVEVNSNGNKFQYCHFYYGGGSSYLSVLNIYDGKASVTNCVFAHNTGGKSGDFYYGALDATGAKQETIIRNNVFFDNHLPLSVSSIIDIDNSNVFHDPDDPAIINVMNGIFIYDQENITKVTTWGETEVPFVINDNDLWIVSPGSLTLAQNVIVKFTPDSYLVIGEGTNLIFDSSNYFTSLKDDAHGGDTNGDGDATTPSDNDWGGIYVDVSSTNLSGPNILYDFY